MTTGALSPTDLDIKGILSLYRSLLYNNHTFLSLQYPFTNDTSLLSHSLLSSYSRLNHTQWWVGILELVVFVIGAPANMIVLCLALLKKRTSDMQAGRKRNITKYLVISMTLADLLFCLVHSPMMFLSYTMAMDLSAIPCVTLFAITHLSTVASSLSLLLINIDKFLHLRRPLHYVVYVTTCRGAVSVLLCWCVSIGWSMLFIFGSFMAYDESCNVQLTDKNIYILFAIGFFVVPTMISLVISVYVALVVFEARMQNGRSRKNSHCERFPLQTDLHSGYTSTYTSGSTRRQDRSAGVSVFKKSLALSNGSAEKKYSRITICTPASYKPSIIKNGNYFLASHLQRSWSLHQHNVVQSPDSCRRTPSRHSHHHGHQFRRIGFVFTTTLWSTFTVLPFRICYIIWNMSSFNKNLELIELQSIKNSVSESVYFCLFALMALNAAGNPFITIITQRQYSARLVRLWRNIAEKTWLRKMAKATGFVTFGTTATIDVKRRVSL